MILLFRLVYQLVFFPLFLLFFLIAALFNKKIAAGLKMRLHQNKPDHIKQSAIWIHASSGEFEYAKPLITAIKAQHSNTPILVTYFSPTYAKNIEGFKGVDMAVPLPMDLPGPVSQFLSTYKPRALLFARTDLWPEVLVQCRQKRIPTYVFSAVVNKNSSFLAKWWREFLFGQLTKIFVVSNDDKNALSENLQKKTEVIGDTRFDQVFARLENPKPLPIVFHQDAAKSMVVCGSTWSEDEEVLVKVISEAKDLKFNWVIAAHEPTEEHLSSLEKKLKAKGLASERLSNAKDLSQILLIDRVGILAELYTKADIAFVGGSFKRTVHSVMEPLAAGCMVFVGPYHFNNGEAMLFKDKQLDNGFTPVIAVNNAEEFAAKLKEIGQRPLKDQIKQEVKNHQGATAKLLQRLSDLFTGIY